MCLYIKINKTYFIKEIMKYVLLCGYSGNNNYSLPSPLNYINGKHMIEYIIEDIPSNEIYIMYNSCLNEYNFQEIVINLIKTKNIYFSMFNDLMRGPVEAAYTNIDRFNYDNLTNESFVFIEANDNFIGYAFSPLDENKISSDYFRGIYGFKNVNTFKKYAKQLLEQNIDVDFDFSNVYKLMLNDEDNKHIDFGLQEKKKNVTKLRICFDLDNTLVTFPTIPNDYTSVKPIMKMINLLISLKLKGHEIIIYTARRMRTHHNNIGKVIKDIALVTIDTLEKFNIPYDELIFGKPIADIYIDDKALNPYVNTISYFGL